MSDRGGLSPDNADTAGAAGAAGDGPSGGVGSPRAAARAKGLRPGRPVIRRAKDLPGAPRSRPGDNGRDPRLLGDQIDSFVADRGWKADLSVGAVIGRWPHIVGDEVAAHSHPVEFVDGALRAPKGRGPRDTYG